MSYQERTGPLMANSHPGSYCGQDAYNDMLITSEIERRDMGDKNSVESDYVVRRLTPTECARLQGFPDDWCADVEHSDSAEYKLWGNGIALPCILPMMKAMAVRLTDE